MRSTVGIPVVHGGEDVKQGCVLQGRNRRERMETFLKEHDVEAV